ncbi:unnamed protein product [Rotaria sordida]|uniref:Translocon-associated protein subunit delta n=1 Tax=Rotaria sordida TaxID=392033 RepID=A0A813V5A0_9BILA|nr:unnamed protein product [Rotaria sordida]CAF0807148.1 unnamed protein product [Rotaria sordida]CAF0834432.1 unnamed protein product [Rotaria sordida]CAF0835360.1 unnamed protein product [Rotaria sordida]CAF0838890.1 unnamed protein product [Rotaria sordida]
MGRNISMISIVLIGFVLFAFAKGENCESPQFQVSSYSTKDARLTAESAAQLEITIKCKSGKQPNTLYADMYGQVVPCAQSISSPGKYYVSVAAATHKQLAKGSTVVKLYDDESYSALRKARTEDAVKAAKPFGVVEINHPGASYGPWLPSEFFAVIIFGLIWWAAYRERSKILT